MPRTKHLPPPEVHPEEKIRDHNDLTDYVTQGLELNPNQRLFLASRSAFTSDAECCKHINISMVTLGNWRNPHNRKYHAVDFIEAERRLHRYGPEVFGRMLFADQLARAALVNEAALSANKRQQTGKDRVETVPDWNARLKATEHAMRAGGMWMEKRIVETPRETLEAMRDFADALRGAGDPMVAAGVVIDVTPERN